MINENDYIDSKTLSNNLDITIQEEASILKQNIRSKQSSNNKTISYV